MHEVRGGTPLKRLLLIEGIGDALIALTIVVLVSIIEAPQDGRLFGYGMAVFYSFKA